MRVEQADILTSLEKEKEPEFHTKKLKHTKIEPRFFKNRFLQGISTFFGKQKQNTTQLKKVHKP